MFEDAGKLIEFLLYSVVLARSTNFAAIRIALFFTSFIRSSQQHLEAFYPPPALDQISSRIAQSGALDKICQQWRIPKELGADLVKIALFDVVLLCDDSGSMQFEQGGERIEDLKM